MRVEAAPATAPLSRAELGVWFGLLQAHANLTRQLDAELEERHRLSLAEHTVLYQLRLAGGHMRMSELASSVLLSPSGVSRLVDRLVAGGLIERQTCPTDGRIVHAAITEAGRRRFEEAEETYTTALRRALLDRVGVAEFEVLEALLPRLAPQCARLGFGESGRCQSLEKDTIL